MLRSVFFAAVRCGGRESLWMIYGVAAAVPENDREGGKEREVDEGTKANRNSWCLNERGQLRLDIQSAEREREGEREVELEWTDRQRWSRSRSVAAIRWQSCCSWARDSGRQWRRQKKMNAMSVGLKGGAGETNAWGHRTSQWFGQAAFSLPLSLQAVRITARLCKCPKYSKIAE